MPNAPVPAAAPGLPNHRRSFLRGLASLPLIGGAVTLIGQPTAAAEPVTRDLLLAYGEWLWMERRVLGHELFSTDAYGRTMWEFYGGSKSRAVEHFHLPEHESGLTWRSIPQPSSRAAVVLSAVGCDWRQG